MLAIPRKQSAQAYMWDEVYVGKSTQVHGGQGLFAKWDLVPGLMFPVAGCRASPNHVHQSHTYVIKTSSEGKVLINGAPDLYPHNGIGSFGLAVAMMANEIVTADGFPNCQLYEDYLVVFRTIHKDDELLTYYGQQYESTRGEAGYKDRRPSVTRDRDLETWRIVRSRLDVPPKDDRQALLDGVDETIRMLVREREVVVEPTPLRRVWNPPKLMHLPAAEATPSRPTLVLHPWVVYCMCRGLYVWDQRSSKNRAFGAYRLPLRINIMAATHGGSKSCHYVNEFVKQLRNAMPTPMDEMPQDMCGRILCTCTVDRELTPEEAQMALPAHMQLEGAKHTVQLKNFIILPGNGIKAKIAARGKGMRFHTVTHGTQKAVQDIEALALEIFGYDF